MGVLQTDRQLLEEQTHLMEWNAKFTKSIKRNVQFFFWTFIISIGLWVIVFLIKESI